jgi:two-component system OmpR family sensor kinase
VKEGSLAGNASPKAPLTESHHPRSDSGIQPPAIKAVGGYADLTAEAYRQRIAELLEENARLAEAIAARDALLAVAGHELRNPMTPILGRVEMLKRLVSKPGFEPERVQKSLEQIEWLIGQYMKRATTLLDISRITSGKLALNSVPVNVCGLVRQVVENFRPIAEHAGCHLTSDLPDTELVVMGDTLALEEIIDNLVSNAIKYGRGKPITVSAKNDAGAGHINLHVQDGGPGISAADQARIFERFERAVPQGQHKGGFGVGLWVVRQLTEAMGGQIEIVSNPGAGSRFCVSIPVQSSGESS